MAELSRIGVPPGRVRLVFNLVEDGVDIAQAFDAVLTYVNESAVAQTSTRCRLGTNEIYARVKDAHADLAALAADPTDYKSLIAAAKDAAEKLALAQRLATRRLASGVVPELDACFAALGLDSTETASEATPTRERSMS